MTYNYREKKIVAVLSSELEAGVALNIVGHLAISIGAYSERDIMGKPYLQDGSGIKHIGISKYPFIITKVKPTKLRKLIEDVRQNKEILMVDYPEQMLTTGHDDELAQSLVEIEELQINYLGAVIYGFTDAINQLTGKFSLWR